MTWRRRETVIAAGIVAVGLLAVVITAPDGGRDTVAPSAPRASRPAAASADVAVADLKLELLDSPRGDLPEPDRNPFRFQARPAGPSAARAAGPARPAPAAAPPQAAPAGPPPPPAIPLRFIGLVDAPSQAGRLAIVSDGRGNVFYGKEGDIIEGRYRLLKIGTDALELSSIDGRARQTIRLSGQ